MTDLPNSVAEPFEMTVGPFVVSIEHMKGSVRRGVSPSGEPWERVMGTHYGSLVGTRGQDGNPVDVFVGPDPQSEKAFLVFQLKPGTEDFDEDKAMLGFQTQEEAKAGYLSNYPEGWTGLYGDPVPMSFENLSRYVARMNPNDKDKVTDAAAMEDAVLVGESAYLVDAAGSGGKWTRISILASLAGKWNENGRWFEPDFLQGALADANAYLSVLPRYGESPHPRFNPETGTFDTNPLKEVWKMVRWFTDAASNLWASVDIDGEAEQGNRLLTKVDRKEDIGVSVRWDNLKALRARKPVPRRRMTDGRAGDVFDRSMVGYVFPAVLDHVPNPAFSQAGRWMLDAESAVPMTDATVLTDLPTLADLPALTDLPPIEAEPCPLADETAFDASGGNPRAPGTSALLKGKLLTMDPKKAIAELRAKAAAATDDTLRNGLTDAANIMETQMNAEEARLSDARAQATVSLTDAQKAALDQLTAGVDLASLGAFVANDQKAKDAAAAKGKVTALADAVAAGTPVAGFDLARFAHAEQRQMLADSARAQGTEEAASAALADAVRMLDSASAAAKLAVQGLNLPGTGSFERNPEDRVEVTRDEGDKKIQQVTDGLNAAFDRAASDNNHHFDPEVRKRNQPFVDELLKDTYGDGKTKTGRPKIPMQAVADSAAFVTSTPEGRAALNMQDSARAMTDAARWMGSEGMTDASVNTGNVLNQPSVSRVILQRAYQDLVSMMFMQGYGSDAFEISPSGIGTVLRVMTELWTPPSHDMLGVLFGSQIVGEDQPIPEGSLATGFQNFPVQKARLGVSITEDIDVAMRNGPMDYNVTARALYHLVYNRSRDTDNRFYTETNTMSDEIGAVPVTAEAVVAGNWSYSAGGSAVQDGITYGANVVGVAQINPAYTTKNSGSGSPTVRLADAGFTPSTATAYRAPIVQSRVTTRLDSNTGALTFPIINPITVTVGGTALVQGWLEPKTGNILGANAQFAVDFARGKFAFAASSGVSGAILPTLAAYSYTTNADYIQVQFGAAGYPNNNSAETYFNRILQAADRVQANMAEYPNFAPPSIALSSFTGATPIKEASTFFKFNSPTGSILGGPMEMNYASRNGVDYCQVNAPTVIGDDTLIYFRKGITKYGVDLPLSLKGPFPNYDFGTAGGNVVGTGLMKDSQKWFLHEFFAMITPHARDTNGNILNGKLRKLIMY